MLLRDQIVIQVGDEVDGMVMIRSGDNRQGVCPIKFLQEVWRFRRSNYDLMTVSKLLICKINHRAEGQIVNDILARNYNTGTK